MSRSHPECASIVMKGIINEEKRSRERERGKENLKGSIAVRTIKSAGELTYIIRAARGGRINASKGDVPTR